MMVETWKGWFDHHVAGMFSTDVSGFTVNSAHY